ncbi:protein spaetzle 5 [Chelonus insularis]|uniref:protein spaetzle 5 n=1 Tax=Chelonus insularis TaxID=460826 RepID=UPI00158C609F|nr:protein spaetzle 5 [Chelonus insularis]
MRLLQVFLLVLLVNVARGSWQQPCGSYGCPYQPHYEPFVPAPPGRTPRCAKPGQTFCETLDHYPQQLIKYLVDKCSYNFATILRDEAQYDFNAVTTRPDYTNGYNYPRPQVPHSFQQPVTFLPPHYPFTSQPLAPYPSSNTTERGYTYSLPSETHQRNPFLPDAIPTYQTESSTLQVHQINHRAPTWWATRSIHRSSAGPPPRTRRENPLLEFQKRNLRKRQASPEAISLCKTNSKYLTPKAALNNRGNWMYVVNLPETNENYSQLVRTEVCAVTQCDGICSIPEGYTSRCEQQYVQKRLVALEGSGDRLYTDVFWFPHGCTCQILPNF